MKEKLVEEWLIRARERGGIDHAYGQFLISEGHEILWLGHSRTEFGKDIISISPDGRYHTFQLKDEDLDLKELRSIRSQIIELVETPPVHPRIPRGSPHTPHLITSGLFKEEVTLEIRAMNEGWERRGLPQLEIIGRGDLVPRFLRISDAFWPEKPAHIRDFLSFYLAEGIGDFEPKKFSSVLLGLLPLSDEPPRRKAQRLAAIGLLGNYLLNPFEREGDHWSLFCGWTMIAAHQAWFALTSKMPKKDWMPSFCLAKESAYRRLATLSSECLTPMAFAPRENELDDYTRSRNLILASAIAATSFLDPNAVDAKLARERVNSLLEDKRLFAWGESATPHLVAVLWYAEKEGLRADALQLIENFITELCERNNYRSDEDPIPPPLISCDDALTELFKDEPITEKNQRSQGSWSIESLVDLLARRNRREFPANSWAGISRLEMMSFEPMPVNDGLIWQCPEGHEYTRNPTVTQSWVALKMRASQNSSDILPQILKDDWHFALMFALAHPHRLSPALIGFLDSAQQAERPRNHD